MYRILPPVLRCAWTSPLINEGGKKMPFCIEKAPILDESVLLRQIEGTGVGRSGSNTSFTSNRSASFLGPYHIR